MSNKGSKVGELLELFKDEKATQMLMANIKVSITQMIEDLFSKFVESFNAKLDQLIHKSVKEQISELSEVQNQKMTTMQQVNDSLKLRLDLAETETRMHNLLINGLRTFTDINEESLGPFASKAEHEASQAVKALCNKRLGLSIP